MTPPLRPAVHPAATSRPTVRSRKADHPPRDLASRHLRGVSTLLSVRSDLRGVHAFADVVEESVRWSV